MANTLTNLLPLAFQALQNVSRERVGFIPAVARNSSAARAALNDTIRVPISPATTAEADNTPGVNAPDTGDETIGNVAMSVSKSKHIPVRWAGEETRSLQNAGTYEGINIRRFEQAFRRLCNLIEIDLATAAYQGASRAVGTAGTTPFATADDFSDFANVMEILDDNGAPQSDLKLVLSNAAMKNIRAKQSSLFKANEAGTDELLRDGKVLRVLGWDIHQSGQVQDHTIGTENAAYLLNDATSAIGDTTIALDTGSGTIVVGDFIKNQEAGADARFYGVKTALSAGSLEINDPGLRVAWTDNDSVENTSADFSANCAFHRDAVQLLTRLPAKPEGGDAADDTATVTDPVSGLVFELASYKQFLQNVVHVRIAWGYKVIQSEHVAVLFG